MNPYKRALNALALATHGTCEHMAEIEAAHTALKAALDGGELLGRCPGCPGGRCMCVRENEPWTRGKLPTEAEIRQAFEAWARPLRYRCEWREEDALSLAGYSDGFSQHAWQGWYAAVVGGRR